MISQPSGRVCGGVLSMLGTLGMLGACGPSPSPAPVSATAERSRDTLSPEREPEREFNQPDIRLLRFACAGFDLAVADGAPSDRLLSHSAARAVELGGAPVEAATLRWALLPPQALLEEVEQYVATFEASPDACAGLRAQLERMAMLSGSH
jgi:hypothetical protein